MASIDLGKVVGEKGTSIRNRGDWNSTAQYVNSEMFVDMVTHKGSLWTCLVTNTNVEPNESTIEWQQTIKSIDTIYFNEPAVRENITSGESANTAFGKVSKWFADLKAGAFSLVANHLNETEPGSALDARQGKILKDNIDRIYSEKLTTLDEIDLVTEEGHFVDALAVAELNRNMNQFGTPTSITLPYTAQNPGMLTCYLAAKTSTSASYYYMLIGGRIARLQAFSGGIDSCSFPVCAGEKIELAESGNVGTVILTFIPFM